MADEQTNGNGASVAHFPYDTDFQCQILSMLWSNRQFFLQAIHRDKKGRTFLRAEFFGKDLQFEERYNPLRVLFSMTLSLYERWKKFPTAEMFKIEIKENFQPPYDGLILSWYEWIAAMKIADSEYIRDTLTEFVRLNLFRETMPRVITAHNQHRMDDAYNMLVDTATSLSQITLRPPDNTDFFEDFDKRQERRFLAQESDVENMRFPTMVGKLDDALHGGLQRGEVGLIVGDTGFGKSISLMNLGWHAIFERYANVLHIVLEGTRKQIEDRYESRATALSYSLIREGGITADMADKIRQYYANYRKKLKIFAMLEFNVTVRDIESVIHQCHVEGFFPDLMCLDYLDALKSIRGGHTELWDRAEETSADLKILGGRFNMGTWSASQLKAPKNKARYYDKSHINRMHDTAGGTEKIRKADVVVLINQTDEERENKIVRLFLDKNRDNPGRKHFRCGQDLDMMVFAWPEAEDLTPKKTPPATPLPPAAPMDPNAPLPVWNPQAQGLPL